MSTRVETSRELDVPVTTAYAQWTQFEDMKLFMDGVASVRQLTDDRLRVTFKRRGIERQWDARITEQIPDARIAWESDSDEPEHAGVVTFHRLDDERSKVMVQFDFWPNGFFEHYADKTGLVEHYVDEALDGFASFIEDRRRPTGSWDGIIGRDDLTLADTDARTDADPRSGDDDVTLPPPSADERVSGDPRVPTPEPTLAERHDTATPDDHTTDTETVTEVKQMADGEIVIEERPRSA